MHNPALHRSLHTLHFFRNREVCASALIHDRQADGIALQKPSSRRSDFLGPGTAAGAEAQISHIQT